ncbi:MAG: hypothetical protein K8T90_03615 [Planctomycetes bacterium]|nr:hypothetical protein [Planctomycetota bacterium]
MPEVRPPVKLSLRKKLGFAACVVALGYAVAEAAVTFVFSRTVPAVYWVFEESGPTLKYDPLSGYRVHGGPARVAKFVRGKDPTKADVEYVGGFYGNKQGFPDRDDFSVARKSPTATRLAVLGDSFSGGDLLRPWADACEDSVRERGGEAELLNFSLSGVGLANWHQMLLKEIEPTKYDIDGVVFAVWGNDLARRLYVCDHGGSTPDGAARHMGGRVDTWNPDLYPKSREEALALMGSWQGYVTSTANFDASLRGEWKPSRPLEPFIATKLIETLRGTPQGTGHVGAAAAGTLARELTDPTQGRGRLVAEMKAALGRMGVPVTVVKIPALDELLENRTAPADDDARAFAKEIGARFVDGAAAYAGLDEAGMRAHWYPVDLHWNQDGSDRFAAWMSQEVLRWPVQNGTVRADSADWRTGKR